MKRSLALLEVVIALSLSAILLTALFSSYYNLAKAKICVEKIHNTLRWQFLMQARLNQLFESVSENASFSSENNQMYFGFNNGLDPDPKYCGELTAYLLKSKKGIMLKIRDRKEFFHPDVKKFTTSFFDPKKNEWVDDWKHRPNLPLFVEITIDDNDDEKFIFRLPQVKNLASFS